ncbi:protein fem-1 homolog C [Phycodurus eques]|uniref:protein fem-1 homolog C n=1 Tax=Phycodurus eques TaxID=693459 RepID=UPI002ACE09A5|nr:protein fem-1 homolog C [Phycodurus eques]
MDLKTAVFNAARDGKLRLLEKLLENKDVREVTKLMGEKTNGATPLLMASRYGHLDLVEYLLECCRAPVEVGGSVNFDGETIEGAPPLWAASAAGHLKVVQSLLGHGASVNSTTLTNSTPLRAACFDGHLDIVKYLVEHKADLEVANRHGHTCLMISCYKGHKEIAQYLLERGADVNRKSVKGNTALHDCAESGSLEIMRMLLQYSASMEQDGYGMTPLLSASVTGHTNIVDYLTAHHQTSHKERIDALELLGATFVDKKRDLLGALKYWKKAMEFRYMDSNSVVHKPEPKQLIMAYDYAREVTNAEELDGLISDPDEMRMQALLIRERILGPQHPDTSYYIRYRGAVYADSGNFERCINLWKYALDMQQSNLDPLSPMTASSLLSFAELFSFMLQDRAKGLLGTSVSFEDLMGILSKSVLEIDRAVRQRRSLPPDPAQLSKALSIILHLVCLLEKVPCTMEQDHLKKETIYRFLKLQPRGKNGFSPLHLAADRNTTCVGRYPVCKFPSLTVTAILLECGGDVNSRDDDDNSPLHIAASNGHADIMNLLVSGGAHFDSTNAFRQTACELLDEKELARNVVQPINHTTLQCLAARVIVKHGLRYQGNIPEKLEAFVVLHR